MGRRNRQADVGRQFDNNAPILVLIEAPSFLGLHRIVADPLRRRLSEHIDKENSGSLAVEVLCVIVGDQYGRSQFESPAIARSEASLHQEVHDSINSLQEEAVQAAASLFENRLMPICNFALPCFNFDTDNREEASGLVSYLQLTALPTVQPIDRPARRLNLITTPKLV